jgi:putative PIN family toxin of toxin-antitoxin system
VTQRIVIDANVLFSALYDPASTCGAIVMLAIEGEIELVSPESVRREMERILGKKLGYSGAQAEAALAALPVEWIEEAAYAPKLAEAQPIVRDATDAPLVALALALGAEIVSGDKDLHALKTRKVTVWKPKDVGGRKRKR